MKNRIILSVLLALALAFLQSCSGEGHGRETGSGKTDAVTGTTGGKLILDNDGKGKIIFDGDADSYSDLSVREGMPLFGKQALYVSGCRTFRRDTPELLNLRSRTARFSLPITGAADEKSVNEYMRSTMYDLSGFGNIIRKYSTPLWHVAYVSAAVTDEARRDYPQNPEFCEPDYAIFDPAWTTAAKYMAERGMRSLYEIWNEPDVVGFMTNFDWDGYIRLYLHASQAIKSGDPDAVVGGPALADMGTLGYGNYEKFIKAVNSAGAPLDFVSAHYYANSKTHTLKELLSDLRKGLDGNSGTSIIFTEFNVYTPEMSEWSVPIAERTDFTLQTTKILPDALDAIQFLNSCTDVTQVQWATLSTDNGAFGIITPDGKKTPLYHLLNICAHMPAESVRTVIGSKGISAMASADKDRAGALLWNTDKKKAQKISYRIEGIPYESYGITVYRIDPAHSSVLEGGNGDGLEAVTAYENVSGDSFVWEGTIPAYGAVYISLTTGSKPESERHPEVGKIIRVDNLYKNREDTSYADFDEFTSTARVGTGDSEDSEGLVYITYSEFPDRLNAAVTAVNDMSGIKHCGMRIDYHTPDGWSRSVMYGLVGKNGGKIPFGTGREADAFFPLTAGDNIIEVRKNAPENWDGKAVVSFDIEGTGRWTEAVFTLTETG